MAARRKWWRFGLLGLGILSMESLHAKPYHRDHETGWHWYAPSVSHHATATQPALPSATATMRAYRRAFREVLDRAILDPTPEHITAFMAANWRQIQIAQAFSTAWQRALWSHPEWDPQVIYPAHQGAVSEEAVQTASRQHAALQRFARTAGIWFFYQGQCTPCRQMVPVLAALKARYPIPMLAITTDGVILPGLPDSKRDQGQRIQLGITHYPALWIADPRQKRLRPLATGWIGLSELESRIAQVVESPW